MIAGTGETGVQVALATTRTPAILGKKKARPEGRAIKSLPTFLLGGYLLCRAERDNHLPVILPVDSDNDTALLSNAEGTITVLHLLCLNLVLWGCEVHSRFRPVEGIALYCWVKAENISR